METARRGRWPWSPITVLWNTIVDFDFARGMLGDHARGVAMVLAVALIWVLSSELIQYIFAGEGDAYSKPFFLTYINTALFSTFLLTLPSNNRRYREDLMDLINSTVMKRGTTQTGKMEDQEAGLSLASPYKLKKEGAVEEKRKLLETMPLEDANDCHESIEMSPSTDMESSRSELEHTPEKLSLKETAKLAALFCPLWFLANYTFNLGLTLTSVSSSSTLSTLSGLFTLMVGASLGVEPFSLTKLVSVLLNITGVALISFSDVSGGGSPRSLTGDVFTILSAFGYGCYTSFIKVKLKKDRQVDMLLFFGFLGVINVVFLWPLFLLLNALGVEEFVMPSTKLFILIVLNGMIGTVLCDYLWARAVLLTTPLIATLAISLSIPFSLIADMLLYQSKFTVVYLTGSICVFTGFLATNFAEGKR